jgi:hypothetical protein
MKGNMMLTLILAALVTGVSINAGNQNGSAGDMPAYYDDQLFTINLKELSPASEKAVLAQNKSLNTIYECDQCEEQGFAFVSVLDAIQGDGFNPLWQEVQIVFSGEPVQLTSDDDINDAAAAGEITLVPTSEIYRCSVVGTKK